MKTVSATDAKQRLAALLDAAQREPVLIRRQNRDVAVIMSAEEYQRSKVLYDGTHSGDIISNGDLGALKNEIELVRAVPGAQLSSDLKNFLADMEELVAASEQHGNPIVFV